MVSNAAYFGDGDHIPTSKRATPTERGIWVTASSAFDRGLQAIADEERRAISAQHRLQRADRRMADGLSGTFLGTLVELADACAPVTVLTRTDATIRGTITAIGPDAIIVQTSKNASDVLLRRSAIVGVLEPGAGHDRTIDEIPTGPSFVALLDRFGDTNERIAVTTANSNQIMGRIERVGEDQLVITLDGHGDTMTIPIEAIDQVVKTR